MLPDIPAGGYYLLPAVRFNKSCYAAGHWFPAFYDSEVSVNGADLTPVLWCPKYISIGAGVTATVEISPQPFNICCSSTYSVSRFIKAVVLGVSYSDLAR
jgi:hypothetical protein